MTNKKLIINADDFGLTPGVTQGIIEAHNNGIVTSTTALTVSDYFLDAMKTASIQAPTLGIGIHLTLTLNNHQPILPREIVPSLVDDQGHFWNQNIFEEKVNVEEVSLEWEAQMIRFLSSGFRPTHIDSHHNVHGKNEDLLKVALKLAKKFDLPVRNMSRSPKGDSLIELFGDVPTTGEMIGSFYDEGVSMTQLLENFDHIVSSDTDVFEMNCHPAFLDAILTNTSSYNMKRVEELEILTSTEAKEALLERNILLTNFEFLR